MLGGCWFLPDHLTKDYIGPSWNNFCLLSIPVINLNKGSGNESMEGELRYFQRRMLGNVRISLWAGGWVGKTSNWALRDNIWTSSFSYLAKIKEAIYLKATNIWSRHLISSFPFPSWHGVCRKYFCYQLRLYACCVCVCVYVCLEEDVS